jgi:PAS domain S-box-containing protein
LAVLGLSSFAAATAANGVWWAASERFTIDWCLIVLLCLSYAVGRRGHLDAGARWLVYTLPLDALVRVGTGVTLHPLVNLTALVVPPLGAAILLTQLDVVVLVAVELAVPLVLLAFFPAAFPQPAIVAGPMALTFVVGVLALAFMRYRDHLERLRREELRAREEHFRALVANVPGAVYRVNRDADRHVEYVSDGIRDLAGYGPEAFGGMGRRLDDLIHADDRERAQAERERSLREGSPYALEYRLVGVDQSVRWVVDRGQGVRDAENCADCVDGVLIDISLRQSAIGESGRLTAIVEATRDLVGMAFPDGRLRYLNRAGRRLLGWSDDEDVASRGISDVHPGWALDVIVGEGIPTAIRRGVWARETAVLRADGHEIPVFQVIMAHRSVTGEVEFLSTTMHDLSERAAIEETRKESEERFRLLASAAFEGIAITAEGRIVDANEQLATMLGLERAQLIGRPVMDFVAPESREKVLDHQRRGSEEPYEHLAQRADGSVFPVEIHARSIPFGGRPSG